MHGMSRAAAIAAALVLAVAGSAPAVAEEPPDWSTLALRLYVVGDPGEPFDAYTAITVSCDGYGTIVQDAQAAPGGWYEQVISFGQMPVGTHCDLSVADPPTTETMTAHLATTTFDPGASLDLVAGENVVRIDFTYAQIPAGFVEITAEVLGYTGGSWGQIGGELWCDGLSEPIGFGIDPGTGSSGPIEVPGGRPCIVSEVRADDGGWNGWFSGWWVDPAGWTEVASGATTIFTITLVREYGGEWPPEADTWAEHAFDRFTVGTVYLNKSGGITIEGSIACSAFPPPPDDGWIVVNVDWDAIQYVGRKTALRASYRSGIGTVCWTESGTGPYAWTTSYPYPQGGTMWVYSPDGKFGSGTIHVDAFAHGGYTSVHQDFDPTGGWGPYAPGCDDRNGDGFCVSTHEYYGWAQADLRPVSVKPDRIR